MEREKSFEKRYEIKLKEGFCMKSICTFCRGCVFQENQQTAVVNSLNVPCVKYNFAEIVGVVDLRPYHVDFFEYP